MMIIFKKVINISTLLPRFPTDHLSCPPGWSIRNKMFLATQLVHLVSQLVTNRSSGKQVFLTKQVISSIQVFYLCVIRNGRYMAEVGIVFFFLQFLCG